MLPAQTRRATQVTPAFDLIDARRMNLMRAAQDGDGAAYAALLRDCLPMLAQIARRQGVMPDRVDDVVQDVLITLHRVRHTYDPSRSFNAWLRAVTQRRAIDSLRRTGRQGSREIHAPLAFEAHADGGRPADDSLIARARAARLRAAVAQLPPGQREAVEHMGLAERSLAEAAAQTGRTTGALKVNLHRALKSLHAILGADHD